jgi:hypothetical protein
MSTTGVTLEDRLPPNEYSEYFGPDAVLQPPIVKEKENQNTPRYLEQVLCCHTLTCRMWIWTHEGKQLRACCAQQVEHRGLMPLDAAHGYDVAAQVLMFVSSQLRTQIAQNLAHLKGPPGVQFHERAPDAMDVDELPNLEAKVCLLFRCHVV